MSFLHYCKEIHGFKSGISGSFLCVSTWLSVKGILKICVGLGNKIMVLGQVFGLVIETPMPHIGLSVFDIWLRLLTPVSC